MYSTGSTRLPIKNRDGVPLWDPVAVTGIVVHFIQNHVDLRVPDWHLIRIFYDTVFNWMVDENHFTDPDFSSEVDEKSRRNNRVEKLVLEHFSSFVNDYFTKTGGNPGSGPYEKIVQKILTGNDRIITSKRELAEKYFLPGNEVSSDGYFLYPDRDALRVVLGIIRNWVYREWKEQNLEISEFFTINRLKESDSIPNRNRIRLELIVLENQYVKPVSSPPYFLINLICPVSYEMFSIKISEYFQEIHSKARENRTGINKYMLALKAFPGARIKLSGEVQRVYTDIKWNAKCKRLKNLRCIRILKTNPD